ncbi:MAG: glycosyltransferase [Pyrinomonadaceae bacterium]
MLTGRDIIYISSIEWNFLWQQNQEIAIRLARAGNRVLYIENTGVRAPGLGDAGRVFARLKSWIGKLGSSGVREVAPNLYVCSPLVLPPFGSQTRRLINRRLLLPLVRRAAQSLQFRDALIWTYLPTDTARDLIRLFKSPKSAVVYYCLADFPQLSANPEHIEQSEKSLVESSDVVFANCTKLAQRLGQWTDNVHVFPPGVDLSVFPDQEKETNFSAAVLADENREVIESFPKPVIGYMGGLHKHIDFDLIVKMAASRPDWSWVFVGPFQAPVEKLQGATNIHLLGTRPHELLISYLRTFDVCIVPYLKTAYTETVVPVKINEYLAAGKPIVSTSLPTVCEFNERHHILTTTENDPAAFLTGIEDALRRPTDRLTMARRREVAALLDWQVIVEKMSDLLETAATTPRGLPAREHRVAGKNT